MLTLRQFLDKYPVRIRSVLVDANPNMNDMPEGSAHWRVTLSLRRSRMSLHYSQGPAVVEEPKVGDVLDCLASDASSYENARDFADFCADFGCDTDSRKAEAIYRVFGRQAASLKRMLGQEAYNLLLWETERA